eukprot:scaffold546_cov163-Amphora_coffeaeformis.AAC.10
MLLLPKSSLTCCQCVAKAVWQASPVAVLVPTATTAATAAAATTTTAVAAAAAAAATATTTSTTTTALVHSFTTSLAPLLLLSGGGSGGSNAAMDIGRFKLRLEGIHTYAVITTLLMNASLRLFSATPKRFQAGEHSRNMVKIMFSVMVSISILMGSYTTIVFSLLELYAKRALGRSLDAQVWDFFQKTQPIRESAYDTWILSLVSFQISFVLSLFLNHDKGFDWKIALFGGLAALLCWWKWSTVMTLAAVVLQLGADM